MKTYFVTGASGAIGSALIPLLLDDPDTRVRLLLRAASTDELDARLEALYAFWQVAPTDRQTRSRVSALRGDVTAPAFGVDDDAYRSLCSECTHLVHAAGNVRMNLPIAQARHCSVDSTRHLVELAQRCQRLEKVDFVSTVGVGGRRAGAVVEDWLLGARDFHNTYEQAKAEAEDVLRAQLAHGLPFTVHRPSMVVGDSANGRIIHFQVFYHLCEFLSGSRTAGLAPRFGKARLDIVPADYVARVIAWSSTHAAATGRILHACSGPQLALPLTPLRDRVRATFARAGRRLPTVKTLPPAAFTALLGALGVFMPPDVRRAIRTLPVFLDYLATEQSFANERSQALLVGADLAVPAPDTYLDKVLAYYLAQPSRP